MINKVKVLVVDDSPVYRALLTEIIQSDPLLEVVGSAEDPFEARELIKRLNPDVLTLDIEMPKMNGVQFLKNIMRLRPMPVVMISTLTQHGASATLQALEIGAVDYFPKPSAEHTANMLSYRSLVNEKILTAAGACVSKSQPSKSDIVIPRDSPRNPNIELIAIGASTGGTEAVKRVLSALPADTPPIVITQHISALFSAPFAQRLNESSQLHVQQLAESGAVLEPNCAYVAPGNMHLVVSRQQGKLFAEVSDTAPQNRHKPSVDVMFNSIVESCGNKAIAVLLTGMGRDGANGMLALKKTGATTLVQSEQTCVVWGMPRVATELGAVKYTKHLEQIPQFLNQLLN
ncbi:chemotaxis response regulator protein-glutamate methylesterase [Shewanella waksmanii]|uniref:protein-glutamate methylesterase/protein-glutamine glutaminase n=1 Tax=Shewanella waksmanii TaxID=213783 RepID=UPI00373697C2